ncbi:MAG: type II toxin-antitoxin system RelE/ParE family toxin [Promicromonosporaceae bacterium]|nr:type II toxin-antitoxin system RelE/ParE family toxin [Promicromonosporaceae bacterium]
MVMRYAVVLEGEAQEQLENLALYIAEQGDPVAALKYTTRIKVFCESLSSFPKRGRLRSDIHESLYLIGFERRVSITYRINETNATVTIVGIYYDGQDWEARQVDS